MFDSAVVVEQLSQKSCDLGGQFAELEQKQIQLNLDLELAKQNLQKAQDEAAAMGGNNLSTVCLTSFFSLPFESSDSTQTDVRSENRQLQTRLKNVISLDKMKQALEQKDLDLAAAQKTAREKTELADKKLTSVGKLEEENAKLETAVDEAKNEVV